MPIVSATRVIEEISNSKDVKRDILRLVGDLSGVRVLWNQVLVATYFRPEKTAGGIIRPQTNVGEDEWQGKVGLVIKLGALAYQNDDETDFQGERVEVGEWGVYKVGDASPVSIRGYPCRLVRDAHIRMVTQDPSIIF